MKSIKEESKISIYKNNFKFIIKNWSWFRIKNTVYNNNWNYQRKLKIKRLRFMV